MNASPVCRSVPGGVALRVTVLPRSSRAEIVGIHNNTLKAKVTKAPVDGAANEECRRLVAKLFGVTPGAVRVVQGSTSRHKVLKIDGLPADKALDIIAAL
mgnify:CR=1 FL=1